MKSLKMIAYLIIFEISELQLGVTQWIKEYIFISLFFIEIQPTGIITTDFSYLEWSLYHFA